VKSVLDEIRLLRIPVAIVTDLTAQIQFRKIVYFGLDQYFDYIVTSEEAGHDKPHQAPFEIAVEKMRPKGNCIWMVGDDPTNDIWGGRAAINAVTLQKVHGGKKEGEGVEQPDCVFDDFTDLIALLKQTSSGNT
jgi:putative hydrolase of the HAD superfamily